MIIIRDIVLLNIYSVYFLPQKMSIHCTIESSHGRILDKINLIKNIISNIQQLRDGITAAIINVGQTVEVSGQTLLKSLTDVGTSLPNSTFVKSEVHPLPTSVSVRSDHSSEKMSSKREKAAKVLSTLPLNILLDQIESIENEYMLAVAHILSSYYSTDVHESSTTKKYYQIVAGENIAGKCNEVLRLCGNSMEILAEILGKRLITGKPRKLFEDSYFLLRADCDYAHGVTVGDYLVIRNNDTCSKCGNRMRFTSETAEMRCDSCLRTKKVVGSVLHYDSTYSEGQKSKHNGYDIVRHLRFWLERLQALETKTFEDSVVTTIMYVIKRDGIIKTDLTCEIMRRILKDPCVDATYLNDHVPLLVKTFGGNGPPTFDYDETKVLTARFIRAMNIHSDLKPSNGNKPYYPHFIYKIAEEQFKANPEKLRILNYIHLQSGDTIEKNDKYFADVCETVNDPDSGLVYRPTDIHR